MRSRRSPRRPTEGPKPPSDPRRVTRGRAGVWIPGDHEMPRLFDFVGTQPDESTLSMSIINECRLRRRKYPELLRLFHVPNGGARSKATAGRLKAEGVRASVPDYFLPVPRGPYHGLFLELKKHDGALRPEQRLELEQLWASGYYAVCAWGAGAAMDALISYLEL